MGGFSLAAIIAPAPAAPLYSFKAKEGDNEIAFEDLLCLKSLWAILFARISTPSALWESKSLEGGCVSHKVEPGRTLRPLTFYTLVLLFKVTDESDLQFSEPHIF